MGPSPWAFISRRGLRDVVMWLLSDPPMNGAEVTRAVEEFTWDFWKSFPSSVYPLLLGLGLELIIGYRVARMKNIAINLTQSLYARR
jgi:DNA-binding PadR family transcriptional regulator